MENKDIISWSPWLLTDTCEILTGTTEFNKPIKQDTIYNETIGCNSREYRIKSGSIIEIDCDFFINNRRINSIRKRAWKIIEERQDCLFILNTSYIENFYICIPSTWGKGWQNVMLQLHINPNREHKKTKKALDTFIKIPSRYKSLLIEPINKHIDLERYLTTGMIDRVICSGGSENKRRIHIAESKINTDLNKQIKSISDKQWNNIYNPNNELRLVTEMQINTGGTQGTQGILENIHSAEVGFVDIDGSTKLFFPLPITLLENLIEENENSTKNEHYSDLNIVKQIRSQCELYDLDFSFRSTGDKIIINEKVYNIKNNQDKQSLAQFFELNVEDRAFNWDIDLAQIDEQNTINSASKLYKKLQNTYYMKGKQNNDNGYNNIKTKSTGTN